MTKLMNRLQGWQSTLRAQAGARRRVRHSAMRGMTLVEIMVVVAIIGLLTAAVATAVIPAFNRAKQDTARTDIATYMAALKTYYIRVGKYPDSSTGLKALEAGQYVEQLKQDPWKADYVYTLQNGKPVITSYGADNQPGGEGFDADISSADSTSGTDKK